jgi:hypothetical protein
MTFLQQTMQKLSARQERLRRSAKLPASRSGRDYARSIRKAQKALRLARYLMLQTFAVVSRDTVLGARWHFSQTMQGRRSSNIKKARSLAGLEASSVRRRLHFPRLLMIAPGQNKSASRRNHPGQRGIAHAAGAHGARGPRLGFCVDARGPSCTTKWRGSLLRSAQLKKQQTLNARYAQHPSISVCRQACLDSIYWLSISYR